MDNKMYGDMNGQANVRAHGTNALCLSCPFLDRDDTELLGRFNKGMEDGEFTIYLQPKCYIDSGKIMGAEALVRWNNKEEGLMPPGAFVPILERSGLIAKLDQFVWDLAAKTIRRWMDEDRLIFPISVNVSRVDIQSIDVIKAFRDIIRKYDIPAEYIEIEITESAYIQNEAVIKETEEALKNDGFKILIDDFGSGYSSLNMLKDVEADILKLDMKFLEFNAENKDKGVEIIHAVLDMAHQLDLPTIAEGIENGEQLKVLELLGCEYAQGFYFFRPMPIEEFEKLVDNEENVGEINLKTRKLGKSYLNELTEYFLKVAEVNLVTGEFKFIKNIAEPEYLSTPRPATITEYIERYIENGIIHSDDVKDYRKATNLDNIFDKVSQGKRRIRHVLRYKSNDGYVWHTFEATKIADFSEENPWVLFTWKRADDEAASREDTLNIAFNTFLKMSRVNLNTEKIELIREDDDLLFQYRHFSNELTKWCLEFVSRGMIHPADKVKFLKFTDANVLRKKFVEDGVVKQKLKYRRKSAGKFVWVLMEMTRSKEFSRENPIILLTIRKVSPATDEDAIQIKGDNSMADKVRDDAIYDVIINFTKNETVESPGLFEWETETGGSAHNYLAGVEYLADSRVLPEYREIYRNFMQKDRMIYRFNEGSKLESLDYLRIYNGSPNWMRIMMFLFEEETTGDIMGNLVVLNIDESKRIELRLQDRYSGALEAELAESKFMYEVQRQLYDAYKNPNCIRNALEMVRTMLRGQWSFLISYEDGDEANLMVMPDDDEYILKRFEEVHKNYEPLTRQIKKKGVRFHVTSEHMETEKLVDKGIKNILFLPVFNSNLKCIGIIGALNVEKTDIKETQLLGLANNFFMAIHQRQSYDLIKKMGTVDLLTGLYNRNSYEKYVDENKDIKGVRVGCLYIDVNGLHELNNEKGHDAGDEMLKFVAKTLSEEFDNETVYRTGGDEFIVIVKNHDLKEMNNKVTRIKRTLSQRKYHISVGVNYTDKLENFNNLIRAAELEMYADKKAFYEQNPDIRNKKERA